VTATRPAGLHAATAAGFVALGLFQAALALGAPFGRAAWGGGRRDLPPGLRLASALAVPLYAGAAVAVLARGTERGRHARLVGRMVWGLACLMAVGAILNAASSSRWERFGWAPFAAGMALACAVVAHGEGRPVS
jgi:hypothetical protein